MNREFVHLPARWLQLVGDLLHVGDDALVVLCHGFTSDRHSRGRFPAVAQALAARSISSLAFDFAGCGDSDDDVLTLDGQVADLRAVLSWVRRQGYRRLGVYGHSLGGLVALLAARVQVQALAVSGAPTGPMHYDWQALYGIESMVHLERDGVLTLPSQRSSGTVLVARSMLEAFAEIDQATLLAAVRCPVLLMHGGDSNDSEEQQLLAHTRRGLPLLPPGSHLHVVAGAGHSFQNHVDELVDVVVSRLAQHLASPSDGTCESQAYEPK